MPWFDALMLVLLVIVMPLRALANSFGSRRTAANAEPRLTRYRRSMAIAAALTAGLAAIWIGTGRLASALGFDWPLTTAGVIGLAITGLLLTGLALTAPRARAPQDPATREAALRTLPQGALECRWFVAFGLTLGFAWELLYRGYLLWLLAPYIGTVVTIVIAATAYGLAHGYQNPRQLVGSIISAFVFTIAFALTHSLWWLIILHAGLPMIGLLVPPPPESVDPATPEPAT